MSHIPRVALVRGVGLSVYEMQSYEPLLSRYDMRAFALSRNTSDLDGMRVPYEKLSWRDSIAGRSVANAYHSRFRGQRYYMPGLEERLHGYDIVHSAEIASTFSWQVAHARKKHGYAMIVTSTENVPFPGWQDPETVKRKREVISKTDFFLALTEEAKAVLLAEDIPDEKIRVIPFGLDLRRFCPAPPNPAWTSRYHIEPGHFVILFAGRLVWEKGIFDLLAAVRQLSLNDTRVLIAGDGPERDRLRHFARTLGLDKHVTFTPSVRYADVEQLHRLASVLVLPSLPTEGLREQFGLVLAEAMACGVPVVAARTGSMPGVVGCAGLLVNPGDFSTLVTVLRSLQESPEMRRELGQRGRARAEQLYDRNRVAAQIDEVYRTILHTRE